MRVLIYDGGIVAVPLQHGEIIDTYDLNGRPVRLQSAKHPVEAGRAGVGADGNAHPGQQPGGCTG